MNEDNINIDDINKLSLDLSVPRIVNVRCVQGDTESRKLIITLTNDGEFFPLDNSITVKYKLRKPDGKPIYNGGTISVDDGRIHITLSEQATACVGVVRAELQLLKNSQKISTMPFNIIVEPSVVSNEDILSEYESDVVDGMIKHLDDCNNPHKTTKEQIGLGNVDNTHDIDKNVNSAKKLTTARNINGTLFDGTTDIITDKWGKLRTVKLSGDVSASKSVDGSADIDIAVEVKDNSHNHTVSNISDLTATVNELNVLDGITATTTELNYTDGVTSNIQSQLDAKAPIDSPSMTGTPKAPTASAGTNNTQIATTAFTQTTVNDHNISTTAHDDIRNLIVDLTTRLNALADSDDTTLDQLSEIVAYIKSNRTLIENVTTNKVNVSDIVDNLTSISTNKPLSAKQGKILKDLIDSLTAIVGNKVEKVSGKGLSTNDYTTDEKNKLSGISVGANVNVQPDWNTTDTTSDSFIKNKPAIPTKISELINDSGYLTSDNIGSTSRINLPRVTKNVSYQPGMNRLVCEEFSKDSEGLPSTQWYHVLTGQGSDANYNTQLAIGMTTSEMHYRNRQNGTWGTWKKIPLQEGDLLTIAGCISATKSIKTQGTSALCGGEKIKMWSDNEGGNLEIISANGKYGYQMDASDDNFRVYCFETSPWKYLSSFYFTKEGKLGAPELYENSVSLKDKYATLSHTHNYLPLTGGTLSGNLTVSGSARLGDMSIASDSTSFYIGGTGSHANDYPRLKFTQYANAFNIVPTQTNCKIGQTATPFEIVVANNIYNSSGLITTSDRNKKKDFADITQEFANSIIDGLNPTSFKYNNGDSGRTHYGLVAQDVEKLLEELGIDSKDFAPLIKNYPTKEVENKDGSKSLETDYDAEPEYFLRYEGFIGLIIKYSQGLKQENNDLKDKMSQLEERLELLKTN